MHTKLIQSKYLYYIGPKIYNILPLYTLNLVTLSRFLKKKKLQLAYCKNKMMYNKLIVAVFH